MRLRLKASDDVSVMTQEAQDRSKLRERLQLESAFGSPLTQRQNPEETSTNEASVLLLCSAQNSTFISKKEG